MKTSFKIPIRNKNKNTKIRRFDHEKVKFSVCFVFTATPQIQKLMTVMIRQHETLFPLSKDVIPSPPSKKAESQKNAPRSFVGWESAEVRSADNVYGVSLFLGHRCIPNNGTRQCSVGKRRHSKISKTVGITWT